MKILAIRGKNLASLEGEFEIDFRKEPLRSAGIFAITGNTGSGKSTLLDAMCIALFNNSPRINNVTDNADITDTSSQTIKEKDCRNIMRRGCADAYAEVDFAALSGKEFRARWSVRRSRDRHDGKLQDYTYSLYNLTDSCELQGVKSELLAKVRELIGLTFEQFTRAVLLAQGEFATFLKAPSKNKAEILEKLTGTDIYSKISIKIHEKRKEAEAEQRMAEEKMKETCMLSDEEMAELDKEYTTLADKRKELEERIKQLIEKQKWFERKSILDRELKTAEEEMARLGVAIEKSAPLTKQLKQIESIQPIRDTYNRILICKRSIKENEEQTKQLYEQSIKEKAALAAAEKTVTESIARQTKTNTEWNSLQPKIKEAMRTESECKEKSRTLQDARKEAEAIAKQYDNERKKQADNEKKIATYTVEYSIEKRWFEEHKIYEPIIAKADVILANIADAVEAEEQIKEKGKLLIDAKKHLQRLETSLNEEKAVAERLNTTMTTEIASLRARLVDGVPCPVCGSLHHLTTATSGQTLHEEELIKAKKDIEERLSLITKSIENSKNEIARLQASIESYTTIHTDRHKKLSDILATISDSANYKSFAESFKRTATEWEKHNSRTTKLNELLAVAKVAQENSNNICKELRKRAAVKELHIATMQKEYDERNQLLKNILGNFISAEQMEESCRKKIEKTNEILTKAVEERNTLLMACEKNEALLGQCKANEEKLKKEFENLKNNIEVFLEQRNDRLTLEELHRLATTPAGDIEQMRNRIEELKTDETKVKATLQERRRNCEEHQKVAGRPQPEETAQTVALSLDENERESNAVQQRQTTIYVLLKNDKENRSKYNKYKREYEKRTEKAENWQKLYELFGSADGAKFKVMAQGYTLDILLGYANKHLKEISQRYQLARVSGNTLSIKVIDLDMLSESRSVHSLSGGESFLISLALALALSSLSSNKMSIESLFIDEGFGSLDSETLRVAMEALEKLQNQGRKIGVISHLHEMIERIPTQIKIVKHASGRSKVVI